MYPTHNTLAQLRAELDLDDSTKEGSGSCEDSRYRRPWHWLPEMRCCIPSIYKWSYALSQVHALWQAPLHLQASVVFMWQVLGVMLILSHL